MVIVIRYRHCLVFISRSSDLIQYGGIVTKANVTTTVSSVNFSVQDSMSIQYSCGEISFTQHSMVQFQTSTHLQRLVHPAVPPAAQQPTH